MLIHNVGRTVSQILSITAAVRPTSVKILGLYISIPIRVDRLVH